MEDLAFYNQGCKALSLLITILANVVIFRLLSRDALGIGSTVAYSNTCAGKNLQFCCTGWCAASGARASGARLVCGVWVGGPHTAALEQHFGPIDPGLRHRIDAGTRLARSHTSIRTTMARAHTQRHTCYHTPHTPHA